MGVCLCGFIPGTVVRLCLEYSTTLTTFEYRLAGLPKLSFEILLNHEVEPICQAVGN